MQPRSRENTKKNSFFRVFVFSWLPLLGADGDLFETVQADFSALPWAAGHERQLAPTPVNRVNQPLVRVRCEPLAMNHRVPRSTDAQGVERARVRKPSHNGDQLKVRRGKETAIAIDQRLPMKGRVIHVDLVVVVLASADDHRKFDD